MLLAVLCLVLPTCLALVVATQQIIHVPEADSMPLPEDEAPLDHAA